MKIFRVNPRQRRRPARAINKNTTHVCKVKLFFYFGCQNKLSITMKHFIILFLLSLNCLAQQQAANWYFGSKAGIKFDAAGNVTAVTDGELSTGEGCAALSDTNGNLQMYTDGVTVYNKLHQIMPNGTGLMGDPSTTQSATIVPKPGSSNLFYVFTLDAFAGANGFRFSVVDMAANGGLGAVTSEKNVLIYTPSSEKIAVVKHANNIDYWVVTHGWNNNAFNSYLLTSSGLSALPVVSNVGVVVTGDVYAIFCPLGENFI